MGSGMKTSAGLQLQSSTRATIIFRCSMALIVGCPLLAGIVAIDKLKDRRFKHLVYISLIPFVFSVILSPAPTLFFCPEPLPELQHIFPFSFTFSLAFLPLISRRRPSRSPLSRFLRPSSPPRSLLRNHDLFQSVCLVLSR